MFDELKEYYRKGLTKSYDFRYLALEKLENSILYYYNDLVEAFRLDLNKGEFETIATEVGMVLSELRYFKKNLAKLMNPKRVKLGINNFPSKGYIVSEPYGVVLIASPWNYPFNLCFTPLVGAIASGNVIYLKVSDKVPNIKNAIKKILSIFPSDYIYVASEDKQERDTLFDLPFDYVFYTGSNKVAKDLMARQSRYLTPLTLELGGKSPCIIDEESLIEVASKRVAWGKFLNAGQTCVAPDYVVVHASIKEKFIESVIKYTKELYYINDKLREDYVKVISETKLKEINDLLKGEKIIFGGKITDSFMEPTIVDEVSFDSKLMQEELFAPILPILTYHNLDELLDVLETKDKPLALYYFTTNKQKAKKVINRLSFGGGCINDTIMHLSESNLPFGGVGMSGMNSYHGKKSYDTFSHYKSILVKHPKHELNFKYPPYSDKKVKLVKTIFKIKNRSE